MLNRIFEKLKKLLLRFKGPFSKAGAFINWKEVHRALYGIVLGLITFRLKKLQKHIRANNVGFVEWENSNSHYSDKFMIYTYLIKWILILNVLGARSLTEAVIYAILGA